MIDSEIDYELKEWVDKATYSELFDRLATWGDSINSVTGSLDQYITDSLNYKAGFVKEPPVLRPYVAPIPIKLTADEQKLVDMTKTKPQDVFAQVLMESFLSSRKGK